MISRILAIPQKLGQEERIWAKRTPLILAIAVSLLLLACQGSQGAVGPQGAKGDQGPQGVQGEPGHTPTENELLKVINQAIDGRKEELRGPQGPTGPQGAKGDQGNGGPTGLTGPIGLTGPQGPKGDSVSGISEYLSKVRKAIVYIEAGSSLGTGTRISQNEILTAWHVVGGSTTVNVSVTGVGRVLAQVKGYDTQRDIALLTFSSSAQSADYVTLPTDVLVLDGANYRFRWTLGTEVSVIGYVPEISTTTPVTTFGHIGVLWNIIPGDISTGQIDAAVTNGMSGGGVFNSYGELIGILLTRDVTFDGDARYLTASEINEVIANLRSGAKS